MKDCAWPSPRKSGTANEGPAPPLLMRPVKSVCCAARIASVAAAAPVIQTIRFILVPQFKFHFHIRLIARKLIRKSRQLCIHYRALGRKVQGWIAAAGGDLHIAHRSVPLNGESDHHRDHAWKLHRLPGARDVIANDIGVSAELLAEG